MKPSPISTAMLLVSLLLSLALLAQSPDSANQSAASPAASAADVPRLIKFSGTLLDAQDRPMAGLVGVTFALHAQQTGGAALWIETQNVKPDANGLYTVLLGANSANGVPAELFASGEARWLEVQVERQAEQPRVLLVSVPYALKAKDAETLGGKPASAFVTTETLAGTGNSAGGSAAPSSSTASTALPSSKAQTTIKKASSAAQPAVACTSVTSDGTATANSIAKFTTACNVQNSAITETGGNVGIGTAAPAVALDIVGNNAGLRLSGTGTHQVTVTGLSSGRLGQDANGFFFASDTNGKSVRLLTNNGTLNEWMRITSAGNVGIGTTTPTAKLDVTGNLNLPATTSATMGVISLGGTPFVHNFGPPSAFNTFIGVGAGNFSMTGANNSAVGPFALSSNTTGFSNAAFGGRALQNNTTGAQNSAFGDSALLANTSGGSNAAFGSRALTANTTGTFNFAFGTFSLFSNTTGVSNSAFGGNALQNNTTGGRNSAFGLEALLSNTIGSDNAAFGSAALQLLTVGFSNIAIGALAGSTLATGNNNIYIGNTGVSSESNTIRIGSTQTATFLAGPIMGNLTGNATTATSFTGSLAGEVTGTQSATVVSNAVAANAPTAIVRRDGSGNFAAGTIMLAANLALPNTSGPGVGAITLAGGPFVHDCCLSTMFGLGTNTFIGMRAGNFTSTGGHNTASGDQALGVNTTGDLNTASGSLTLFRNTTGTANTASGYSALVNNTTGGNNTALGVDALLNNTTGSSNIGIGNGAGSNATTGDNNIYIGSNTGVAGEGGTIRIGAAVQTRTFIAGISGVTVATGDGVGVFVGSQGQLGTAPSSRRFKDDIADMAGESDLLMKLRPVAFYYKPELDETHTRQYGLVAEEVAQVSPDLVVFDKDGVPMTVRYHFVNAMLLNEVQKQQSTIARQHAEIQDLAARLAKLEALVAPVQ